MALLATSVLAEDPVLRVAMTIYTEARGESLAGKQAVANVIYNRAGDRMTVKHETWGKALVKTCQFPAFSCWKNIKAPNMRSQKDRQAWRDSYRIAVSVCDGSYDPKLTSRFYHEKAINPYWATNMRMIAKIGNHKFY